MQETEVDDEYEVMTQSQLDGMVQLHQRFLDGRLGGRRAVLKRVDLTGLSLSGQNMRQADFTACLMRRMDLSHTDFQEASLYACDLADSNLNDANFVRSDLRGARIEGADLAGADLEKADLRGGAVTTDGSFQRAQYVNFRGADLSGAKLSGSMATNADFSDAILTHANMEGADLRGAQMEGADLSGADIEGVQLSGANLKSAILMGVDLQQIRDRNVVMVDVVTDDNAGVSVSQLREPLPKLVDKHKVWVETAGASGARLDLSGYDMRELVTLKQAKLTAIKAERTQFFRMNLYQIEMQSAILDKSDFRNCDMVEADLRASSMRAAKFNHANLERANFAPLMFGEEGARRYSPCNLEGAYFRYAELHGANLMSANLRGADLSYADLSEANLKGADLTGAILEGAIFDEANLTDTKMAKPEKGGAFSLKALKESDD